MRNFVESLAIRMLLWEKHIHWILFRFCDCTMCSVDVHPECSCFISSTKEQSGERCRCPGNSLGQLRSILWCVRFYVVYWQIYFHRMNSIDRERRIIYRYGENSDYRSNFDMAAPDENNIEYSRKGGCFVSICRGISIAVLIFVFIFFMSFTIFFSTKYAYEVC